MPPKRRVAVTEQEQENIADNGENTYSPEVASQEPLAPSTEGLQSTDQRRSDSAPDNSGERGYGDTEGPENPGDQGSDGSRSAASRHGSMADRHPRDTSSLYERSSRTPQPLGSSDTLTELPRKLVENSAGGGSSEKESDARKPDKFDGSDRSKLRSFLNACRLYFLNQPKRFNTDRKKVLYAGSFLDGTAASWFEPYVTSDGLKDDPILSDWSAFEAQLKKLFGDPDELTTFERKLERTRMRYNDHVADYITKFQECTANIHWNEDALMFVFRKGLTDRILDQLALREKAPESLSDLKEIALNIDLRYWDRQAEKGHDRAGGGHTNTGFGRTFAQRTFGTRSSTVPPRSEYRSPSVQSSASRSSGRNFANRPRVQNTSRNNPLEDLERR